VEIFDRFSLLAFAFRILFGAEPLHLSRKTVWAICPFCQRKEAVMRMASDLLQQEKRESNRCMVREIWIRQRFGRTVGEYQIGRRDQIERGWISDEIVAV
jgi:hypothetical protein